MAKYSNLIQVMEYFADRTNCIEYFEQMRWGGKPVCPKCGCEKVYRTNRGLRCSVRSCQFKFTVTSGTILENTKIPLKIWIGAMYLHTAHKKGVSSCQLARDLGITQKTAWFLLHRIREVSSSGSILAGTVEVDETYIGGKESNKHRQSKTGKQGRGTIKQPVLAMVERQGNVKALKLNNVKSYALTMPVFKYVATGSTVITDAYNAYFALPYRFKHEKVNHSKNEFVRGNVHTNSVEGFFSQMKRGIYGIYHQVSTKHLDAYCNEFAHRHNTRKLTDTERFDATVKQIVGHRLTYKQLISR